MVYSGVRLDAGTIWACATHPPDEYSPFWFRLLYAVVFTADLPLSGVADTLLLPVTVRASIDRAWSHRETNAAPPAESSAAAASGLGPDAAR